ncbi:MAG: aldehyde dehydrogenase family protein [Planctomycetota bacterium]|nr:MAG: aldehyde dehydrogenase family protein [Planctomycetota bacterium]
MAVRPGFLGGQPWSSARTWPVRSPESGANVAQVALAGAAELAEALAAAAAAAPGMAAEPAYVRQERLYAIAAGIEARAEEFARCIVLEAGKPMRYARGEVERAVRTFRAAGEEAVRVHGEVLPLDSVARGAGRQGLTRRVPVGACSFITPFNFPLNLAAHKVAPALAAGCPFVLKPAEKTPLTALLLAEVMAAARPQAPRGAWSVLPALPQDTAPLIEDARVKLLSFTGSARVGWELRRRAACAKVVLELGGNAATILGEDWEDLETALNRCSVGAFAFSGQVCIKLQRLLVPRRRFDAVADGMSRRAAALRRGPLLDPETEIGPLITTEAAARVSDWIEQARAGGARIHAGGRRDGAFVEPTVLSDVPRHQPAWCDEIFGPVLVIAPYDDFEEALALANDTPYGLQASLFTHDWRRMERAWSALEVGQVILNESPAWRSDDMPYGGVKRSGLGREGVRYAIEEMTELRLLVL